MKRLISLFFVLVLLATVAAPVCVSAAEAPYTYTVRVFAGNMGTIGGSEMVSTENLSYGEEWSFDIGQISLTNDKYYVKGIRESGLDNDEVSEPAFKVTQDKDFVVAYGVKGNEVAYTVSFVRDSDDAQLADSVTYYGNVGDKPVVACKFIDGYYPRYYNITGTLKENADSNRFVFRYAPQPVSGTATAAVPAGNWNPVNPNAAQNTANQNNANQPVNGGQGDIVAAPSGTGDASPGGEEFPPQPESILDMDVPMAEAESQGGEKNKLPGWIVLLLALAAAGLISIPFVVRQLRKSGKNEEADQLEKAYEEELKKKEDKK